MSWSTAQVIRFDTEAALLGEELPHFTFRDRNLFGLTTVRGTHTSAAGRYYDLAVWLKGGFPHEMPGLYVLYPSPLLGFGGKAITSHGTSHTMHVWQTDWQAFTKICFCKEEFWSPAETILGILFKAFLWLEAYEVHQRTNKSIDEFSLSYPSRLGA